MGIIGGDVLREMKLFNIACAFRTTEECGDALRKGLLFCVFFIRTIVAFWQFSSIRPLFISRLLKLFFFGFLKFPGIWYNCFLNSWEFGKTGVCAFEWEFGKMGVKGRFSQKQVSYKLLEIRCRFYYLVAVGGRYASRCLLVMGASGFRDSWSRLGLSQTRAKCGIWKVSE